MNTRGWHGDLPGSGLLVFEPSAASSITIFIASDGFVPDDGVNSVRVYLRQQSGKTFEVPVERLSPAGKTAYGLGIRLYDPQGLRGQPAADGDSLLYVTWRGQMSNALKIGLGSTRGTKLPPLNSLTAEAPRTELAGYRFSGDRSRLMEQATFGPSTDVDFRIRRIGIRNWINEQFDAPYPTFPFPNFPQMPSVAPDSCSQTTNPSCFRDRYTLTPLQQWFFLEAFYGNAQLRHRMGWAALSQIWVTSGNTTTQSSHAIAFHKILEQDAFANYKQLMFDATLSPTMGNYLDMVRSTQANPNENYPREILQLFSIGLYMLNQDGSLQLDSGGNPIPSYNQETINNLSKVFTGWTYCNITCSNSAPGVLNYRDPMILNPANHDTSAKTLLQYPGAVNANIPACTDCTTDAATAAYANDSLAKAIDNIFYHPNVGPFVSDGC